MKNDFILVNHIYTKLFLIFTIIIGIFLSTFSFTYAARPISELKGWAWSSNIGWISMSCENENSCGTSEYRVTVNQETGALSGYAWSSNVGWLKFGGLSNFPTGGGTTANDATLNENNILTGWARFCAGTAPGNCSTMASREDGWEGWLSLSGQTLSGNTYNIILQSTNAAFEGYAWGEDVVGWVDFSQVIGVSSNVSVTLDANPKNVSNGATTTLTWQPRNAISCTSYSNTNNSGWRNSDPQEYATTLSSYTKASGAINADTEFIINCRGANGSSATSSVSVTVGGCPPGGCCSGSNCNPPSCNAASLPGGNYTICSNGGSGNYTPVSSCTTSLNAGVCTYTEDPIGPRECVFPDGTPVEEGKFYYRASLVPSGEICQGAIVSCSLVESEGGSVSVVTPSGYTHPSCRVSPVIRPI